MLFIMNEVILKQSREVQGEEYLGEFTNIMEKIIQSLAEFKSEYLIDEMRKIVTVWEDPALQIFVQHYTSQLKVLLQESIN